MMMPKFWFCHILLEFTTLLIHNPEWNSSKMVSGIRKRYFYHLKIANWGQGGEMNQALYAHMNNKRKMKKKLLIEKDQNFKPFWRELNVMYVECISPFFN
jgi:hypothetical protein